MANAIYPKYKEALLNGSANTNMSSGTVKVALVDTGTYTYSATHEFLSSLSGRVGPSGPRPSPTAHSTRPTALTPLFPGPRSRRW